MLICTLFSLDICQICFNKQWRRMWWSSRVWYPSFVNCACSKSPFMNMVNFKVFYPNEMILGDSFLLSVICAPFFFFFFFSVLLQQLWSLVPLVCGVLDFVLQFVSQWFIYFKTNWIILLLWSHCQVMQLLALKSKSFSLFSQASHKSLNLRLE